MYHWWSREMPGAISQLRSQESFDKVVCDFIFPAPNIERLEDCVLYQHNLEALIWPLHTDNAPDPLRRSYFGNQAKRMEAYERDVSRRVVQVVAVSE